MSSIRCILFDCDGTLVDSEIICSKAYVSMFSRYGITLSLEDIYREFKGVRLYEIIDVIQRRHPFTADRAEMESHYRAEVARLFDSE